MNDLKKRVSQSANLLKLLNNRNYGPPSAKLLNTYKVMIRSKIDYGSVVYNSASRNVLSTLETVQNACLRLILRAFPTTPISSLQALTGTPSLQLRRSILSAKYAINEFSKNFHTSSIPTLLKMLTPVCNGNPPSLFLNSNNQIHLLSLPRKILPLLRSQNPPWRTYPPEIIWDISQRDNDVTPSEAFDFITQKLPDWTFCFCDGSRTEERAGGAFLIDTQLQNFNLPTTVDPLTTEQVAVYQCLVNLCDKNTSSKFIVCTDSKNLLNRIQIHDSECAITSHILYLLYHLQQTGMEIKFLWVPAHSQIMGNETVDVAAKSQSLVNLDIHLAADLKKITCKNLLRKWLYEWSHLQSKLYHRKRNIEDWTQTLGRISGKNRSLETATIRALLGHSKITHQHLLQKTPPPMCDSCPSRIITIHHILTECRKYTDGKEFTDLQPANLPDLVNFIYRNKLNEIL
jgi:ribonuclease HI